MTIWSCLRSVMVMVILLENGWDFLSSSPIAHFPLCLIKVLYVSQVEIGRGCVRIFLLCSKKPSKDCSGSVSVAQAQAGIVWLILQTSIVPNAYFTFLRFVQPFLFPYVYFSFPPFLHQNSQGDYSCKSFGQRTVSLSSVFFSREKSSGMKKYLWL